jgi:hypothetical protein
MHEQEEAAAIGGEKKWYVIPSGRMGRQNGYTLLDRGALP